MLKACNSVTIKRKCFEKICIVFIAQININGWKSPDRFSATNVLNLVTETKRRHMLNYMLKEYKYDKMYVGK